MPLHLFSMSKILTASSSESVEQTVLLEKQIMIQKAEGEGIRMEEIDLPTENFDLENVLPMIDFAELKHIKIVEKKKRTVRRQKKVRNFTRPVDWIYIYIYIYRPVLPWRA